MHRRRIRIPATVFLATVLTVPAVLAKAVGPAAEARGKVRTMLRNTGEDLRARGLAVYAWAVNGERGRLAVRVGGLDVGRYDVLIDGASVGDLEVSTVRGSLRTRGALRLDTGSGSLTVDPRGLPIAVVRDGTTFLVGTLPRGRVDRHPVRFATMLQNVGEEQPGARARAAYVAHAGRVRFIVMMGRAREGTYGLLVDGEAVGRVQVGPEGRGAIRFDTAGHRPGSGWEVLTFRVLGKEVAILDGDTVLFRGRLP